MVGPVKLNPPAEKGKVATLGRHYITIMLLFTQNFNRKQLSQDHLGLPPL